MRPVYFDNNATTRTDPAVVDAMLPFFSDQFGNASSTHAFGESVAESLKQARKSVAALIGAAADHEVIFTSGGTESDNAAIMSALEAALDAGDGRNAIITTRVEHQAILSLVAHLEKTRGITVHMIGVDDKGRLDMEAYEKALGPKTAVVSIMWANNETGTLFPVPELAKMAKAAGAVFHTDAVQAAGKIPLEVKATDIDMLSLSGHKLHGPKGIGVLYVRKGVKFRPLIRGGHQERGRRGGTENVPAIIGLGKAAELALANMEEERTRVRELRDRLEQGVLQQIDHCAVSGDTEHRLPNTSNLAFEYLDGEAIVMHLNRAGIAASTGSACTSGSTEPSHVLRAMNLPATSLHGAVRLSLSRENATEDVDRMLEVLPDIIAKLRDLSPAWQNRNSDLAAAPHS